jgi:hypothetical protein
MTLLERRINSSEVDNQQEANESENERSLLMKVRRNICRQTDESHVERLALRHRSTGTIPVRYGNTGTRHNGVRVLRRSSELRTAMTKNGAMVLILSCGAYSSQRDAGTMAFEVAVRFNASVC